MASLAGPASRIEPGYVGRSIYSVLHEVSFRICVGFGR